jgi:hypothetical protein
MFAVCTTVPPAPVTVTLYCPVGVHGSVETVRVDDAEVVLAVSDTLAALSFSEGPLDTTGTSEGTRETAPVKPLTLFSVIDEVPDDP